MKLIRSFLSWFVSITTGILIISAINCSFSAETLSASILWRILFCGFCTTLVTLFFLFLYERAEKKGQVFAIFFFHYLCLCIVMIYFGSRFGWIPATLPGACMMMLDVAGVYFLACLFHFGASKKEAKELNERLWHKYQEDSQSPTNL